MAEPTEDQESAKVRLQNLQPKAKQTTCDNCTKIPGPDVKYNRCSACKNVHYCSRACQKAAWSRHKKTCCKIMPANVHLLGRAGGAAIEKMMNTAYDAGDEGNTDQQIRILKKLLKSNPDQFNAWLLLGEVQTNTGLWKKAFKSFTRCLTGMLSTDVQMMTFSPSFQKGLKKRYNCPPGLQGIAAFTIRQIHQHVQAVYHARPPAELKSARLGDLAEALELAADFNFVGGKVDGMTRSAAHCTAGRSFILLGRYEESIVALRTADVCAQTVGERDFASLDALPDALFMLAQSPKYMGQSGPNAAGVELLNQAVAAAREVVTVCPPKDPNFAHGQFTLAKCLFNWTVGQPHRSIPPVIAILEEALKAAKKCKRFGGASNPMLIRVMKQIKEELKTHKKSLRGAGR